MNTYPKFCVIMLIAIYLFSSRAGPHKIICIAGAKPMIQTDKDNELDFSALSVIHDQDWACIQMEKLLKEDKKDPRKGNRTAYHLHLNNESHKN